MNRETFSSFFKVGDEINSGGRPERANAACLEILGIEENGVRYKSINSRATILLKYTKLQVVVAGFGQIDPNAIKPSIKRVYVDAGLKAEDWTENYEYGFAREFLRRQARLEAFRLQKSTNVGNLVTEKSA
jgi:hypothetical protein